MTAAPDGRLTGHTETWCDTTLHVLPTPKDREDPGCHRLIWHEDMWWMIHRIGSRIVVTSDLTDTTIDLEVFRDWVGIAVVQLGLIPRQRTA